MAEQRKQLKQQAIVAGANGVPRGRVLVIDDEPRVTQAITRILCREHEVTVVDRASAALELLQSGARFDVILCDINMPGMSGAELFRELEQLIPEVAARVVFLTAGVATAPVRQFLGTVANACIEKPFRLSELRRVVESLVGGEPAP
jgi:CheY-like chemotaxis protein